MHVLHVIDSLSRGGAERMLVDIANATCQAGEKVSVCITRPFTDLANELDARIEVIELNRSRRFDMSAMRKLADYIKDSSTDVLHVHSRSSVALMALLCTIFQLRVPIVMHDHYGAIEIDPSVPFWFRWWGRYYVSQYVGVSESFLEWAQHTGLKPTSTHIMSNSLDLQRLNEIPYIDLREEFQLSPHAKVGIVVAGLRHEKGIDVLIDMISRTVRDAPFVVLIIGGDRDQVYADHCRDSCHRKNLRSIMKFIGERDDVPSIIRSADFGLLPSRSESGPLVLIEYAHLFLPFAAFEVGNVSRRMKSHNIPGFVPPGDESSFIRELERLLNCSGPDLKERGKIGYKVAQTHFNIQTQLPKWFEIYEQAVQS